jgi:OOP family OmpA-OmpF porin
MKCRHIAATLPASRAALLISALLGSLLLAPPAFAADAKLEPVQVKAVAYFDFNKTSIRPEDQPAILAEVGKMQNVTWQSVTATGHTDSIGSARYNAKLAARRARSVKSYLVGKGLDPSMIQAVGKAGETPVADNDSADGRARNRRTEIVFQGVRPLP